LGVQRLCGPRGAASARHNRRVSRRPSSRPKLVKKLQAAREDRSLVRVERRIDPHPLQGYVVQVGGPWVVLAQLDDAITVDGFVAVRLADITRVRPAPNASFVRRALKLRGEWPPPRSPATLDLRRRRDLIRSIHAVSPVIAIFIERCDPEVCFIGVPTGFRGNKLLLTEITTRAKWWGEPTAWKLGRITRIDWGGRYEQALYDVAGPPPRSDNR
jgi:hypothetical protein